MEVRLRVTAWAVRAVVRRRQAPGASAEADIVEVSGGRPGPGAGRVAPACTGRIGSAEPGPVYAVGTGTVTVAHVPGVLPAFAVRTVRSSAAVSVRSARLGGGAAAGTGA
ncbi:MULTISPECIES: hypothetical protein [Streptomyces]|uniref:hypothetical protein n=1 Tax=Streptomyces TaxID=1883 RepID=UPI00163C436C|nr:MULTISPECIES: hypothetical protein [Streptomyces]MBC2873746.1 hypothetical protein [Streptomyces sp. TYQ1024]UBI37829.1 hypothetical protein K7I03_16030 [Streptomyces mobaraensis]UKW30416.1 hypothetical protein MCU78_15995 [Streptomyces sp. TYQ1024]